VEFSTADQWRLLLSLNES